MFEPMVSVVIPTYNSEKFITGTLDFVKSQTFDDFEVIVINDGSSDSTGIVVQRYIDSNPGLRMRLVDQQNRGIAGARNSGIMESKGHFVAFLDHDDRWYPDKLKDCRQAFLEHPEADLVCHNEVMRDGSGNILRDLSYGPYVPDMYRKLLFSGNCLSTSAILVRREALLDVGMFIEDRGFSTVEDYDLWIRLAKKHKFYFTQTILGEYVFSSASASSNFERHYGNQIKVLRKNFNGYDKKRIFDFILLDWRIFKFHLLVIRGFLQKKAFNAACKYFVRALVSFFDFVI